MLHVNIKKLHPNAVIPRYAHGPDEDAGLDLVALEGVRLYAGHPVLVPTGIALEIPPGFEAQIRSRSGLARKDGVFVINSPATIDPGYRGEVGVLLCWTGTRMGTLHMDLDADEVPYKRIEPGMKVGQLVFAAYERAGLWPVTELSLSNRGANGFGSTGV